MKFLPFLMVSLLLGGCVAGDGEGLDENGQPIVENPDTQDPPDDEPLPDDPTQPKDELGPTLESIQEFVLSPICAQCHFGNNPPAGLRMDSLEASIDNLINIAATLNPTYNRVTPGDAENSFIYLKIVGDPVAGNRMPLGLPALSNETIEVFKQWIESGAPTSNSTPVVSKVSLTTPDDTQSLTISFNMAMEPSTLTASQMNLQIVDKDGVATPLLMDLSQDAIWVSPHTLTLHIPTLPATAEKLTVSFNDDAISTVMGTNGYVLDGEYDGINGGLYHYEIRL